MYYAVGILSANINTSNPRGTAAVIIVENANLLTPSHAVVTRLTTYSRIYLAIDNDNTLLSTSLVSSVIFSNLNAESNVPSDLLSNALLNASRTSSLHLVSFRK